MKHITENNQYEKSISYEMLNFCPYAWRRFTHCGVMRCGQGLWCIISTSLSCSGRLCFRLSCGWTSSGTVSYSPGRTLCTPRYGDGSWHLPEDRSCPKHGTSVRNGYSGMPHPCRLRRSCRTKDAFRSRTKDGHCHNSFVTD